jgi:hypothetical protein
MSPARQAIQRPNHTGRRATSQRHTRNSHNIVVILQ